MLSRNIYAFFFLHETLLSFVPTFVTRIAVKHMAVMKLLVPQTTCIATQPYRMSEPAIGFPMSRPTPRGIDIMLIRVPNEIRSGHSDAVTAGFRVTNAPEKYPYSKQNTTIPPLDLIDIHIKAKVAASDVQGMRALTGPISSAE